jgi:ABC-type transport system involved in cytochrome bd biosynthesis fused ATPase/permease subunit
MAKTKQQNVQALKSKRQRREQSHLHFAMTSKNYMIIGIGIALIILGYIFMSENSVDGFLPTVIAPILLMVGYCVIVPFGILYKDRNVNENIVEEVKETRPEVKQKVAASSNVKTV